MNYKYIIECSSKKEMECIDYGLDMYKIFLSNEIEKTITSPKLRAEYWSDLRIVRSMLEKLEKDFG